MKANEKHIGLETAKLFEDCEVESKYTYIDIHEDKGFEAILDSKLMSKRKRDFEDREYYPAYTWGEILWENPEEFLGKSGYYIGDEFTGIVSMIEAHEKNEEYYKRYKTNLYFKSWEETGKNLLGILQQKKYEEADKYFKNACVLIK